MIHARENRRVSLYMKPGDLSAVRFDAPINDTSVRRFRRLLLIWASRSGRDFWWRRQRDVYTTAVVEVMLKQTRAQATDLKIRDFVNRYPTPADLAAADVEELEEALRPFGLYRQRAAQLNALGRHMTSTNYRHSSSADRLAQIPGIGPYSVAAIRCFVYGKRDAVIDVNIVRIVMRVFGATVKRGEPRKNREISAAANALLAGPQPRRMNWALLDLGALVCTERNPKCEECPLQGMCVFGRERLSG